MRRVRCTRPTTQLGWALAIGPSATAHEAARSRRGGSPTTRRVGDDRAEVVGSSGLQPRRARKSWPTPPPAPPDRRAGAAPRARRSRGPTRALLPSRSPRAPRTARPAVERARGPARAQVRERGEMGARKIGDVDVIAHAGAVGRQVIAAEHVHVAAFTQRRLAGDLDEVRRAASTGPSAPGIGAGDVEVAERDVAQVGRARCRRA